MARAIFGLALGAAIGLTATIASAQEGGETSGSFSASTSEGVSGTGSGSGERPTENYFELGLFAGAMFPSKNHNLEDSSTESGANEHQAFKSVAPEVGLRLGYYPIAPLGLEVEGAYLPTGTKDGGSASLWTVRGHLVGQIPLGAVTPFAVVGLGRLGASSDAMGKDSDPSFHFGAGVKVPIGEALGVRLDLRDTLTQKDGGDVPASDGTQTHHPEILLGLSYTIGLSKKKEPPPPVQPKDTDGDSFLDPQDSCPTVPGVAPDGCPPPDTDKDGIIDPQDKCPTEPGVPPDGCPDKDADKDNILIPEDKCPTEPGVPPDGCPDKDSDKDGIPIPTDKCPDKPETKNGFQDEDGCPDEIPEAVKKFTGVIQGIEFDFNKATIRPKSKPTLDEAAKVLTEHESIKIEISGHTDNVGSKERNTKLSQERADAVKDYLVSKGINGFRIQTRGAGPDEPIADNKKAEGRQKNRRTEFKILTQ